MILSDLTRVPPRSLVVSARRARRAGRAPPAACARPKITSTDITTANGSICTTSVGILMPATCRAVVSDRQTPNSNGAEQHPERPSARQHGQHDADEAGAVGHEGDEQAGPDLGHVGAAEPGQRSVASTALVRVADHVDAGGVERRRLVARGLKIEAE